MAAGPQDSKGFRLNSPGEVLEGDRRAPRHSLSNRQLLLQDFKQDLKLKTLGGTPADALKIQIWTALIASLMVRHLQPRSRLR